MHLALSANEVKNVNCASKGEHFHPFEARCFRSCVWRTWVSIRDAEGMCVGCIGLLQKQQHAGKEVEKPLQPPFAPRPAPPNSFADAHRALSFVYIVGDGDEAVHFKHAGSDTLELHNNATIKRASTTPTTDALINLPVSEAGAGTPCSESSLLSHGSIELKVTSICVETPLLVRAMALAGLFAFRSFPLRSIVFPKVWT